MKYLLLIYGDEQAWTERSPEEMKAEFEAYDAYTKWLVDRAWMQGGEALESSSTATQVRLREEKVLTTDGPFAETKEQLGGFYLIECDNLDEAIEAAARIPAALHGTIEVRPVMEYQTG